MSVKKLGKAIVSHGLRDIFCSLAGSNDKFSIVEQTEEMEKELESLEEPPEHPNFSFDEDFEVTRRKYSQILDAYKQKQEPVWGKVTTLFKKVYETTPFKLRLEGSERELCCLYKGVIYKFDRSDYSDEEMLLQIMDLEDQERKKFERLQNKFSEVEGADNKGRRLSVPEKVRIAVWRRDEGKCVKCGSRENLEYDHIIPIAKGGSNTVRNIELLCEKCNRDKKDDIR